MYRYANWVFRDSCPCRMFGDYKARRFRDHRSRSCSFRRITSNSIWKHDQERYRLLQCNGRSIIQL